MTMPREYEELLERYVADLRQVKDAVDAWWEGLQRDYAQHPVGPPPEDLWPVGPVGHPRVIAVYRTYFFRCAALNEKRRGRALFEPANPLMQEDDWGVEDAPAAADMVEPKTFVLDLLAGGGTHELYKFLLSLAFVPIGIKGDVLV